MKKSTSNSRPLIIFYLLVGYVMLQFFWWGYHIADLNAEISTLSHTDQSKKIWMILGEGSVFLAILFLATYKIRNTFKKELALSKQQHNFLLSISHELKSPIAAIKLNLQTLLQRELPQEKEKLIIKRALTDNDRLSSLLDNILLATNVENSTQNLQLETINLSELIQNTLKNLVIPNFNTSGIQLFIEKDCILMGDKTSLVSVVVNLVENAVKYANINPQIAIMLKRKNENLILQVSDNGIGIPENEKSNVFKKFYRIGSEETRKTKGTGLGLYIVENIVRNHNGKISIVDNIPCGSIFEIKFIHE